MYAWALLLCCNTKGGNFPWQQEPCGRQGKQERGCLQTPFCIGSAVRSKPTSKVSAAKGSLVWASQPRSWCESPVNDPGSASICSNAMGRPYGIPPTALPFAGAFASTSLSLASSNPVKHYAWCGVASSAARMKEVVSKCSAVLGVA